MVDIHFLASLLQFLQDYKTFENQCKIVEVSETL